MSYAIKLLDGTNTKWQIENFVTLGSDSNCQIQLNHQDISERHFRLEVKEGVLSLKDLRSKKGTFVNSAQVIECILHDGDIVSVGDLDLVVEKLNFNRQEFELKSRAEFWNEQLQGLNSVAKTEFPVLLLGPSGTGKDVLSKKIHEHSYRSEGPFLSVNCSALTETLVESELFGHVKGSFTGAINDRKGAFETARGGTLFLDEIGDLSYSLQAKLLRAIENEEIRPVGSDKIIRTDVRIIAATHQNLMQKIADGEFRSDLYYRLNVITLNVPSLKDRVEDFEDLLYTFAKQMRVRFSHNAILEMKKYEWPGNIRELKNFIAKVSALYPKEYITEVHIQKLLTPKDIVIALGQHMNYSNNSVTQTLPVVKEIEKQLIIKRLAANKGSQKLTAHDLGMPKSTLNDKIKTYGIDVKSFKSNKAK